ncbi:hypothetical protein [Dactylosporangium sp. CA-233914]|uniref:hypothetical protein n=1 Tax=Dactylosporangium sp. CA-233914 TaxID=3239934 RepID=UPI003D8EE7A0
MTAADSYLSKSIHQVPELTVAETTARSVTGKNLYGQASKSGDEQPKASEPDGRRFSLTPSTIRDTENKILQELGKQVEDFEGFKKKVLNYGGWVFVAENPGDIGKVVQAQGENNKNGPMDVLWKDPNPAKTQEIVDGQVSLIRAVGDSIELVAQLVVRLNNAAQIYAEADIQSFGTPST